MNWSTSLPVKLGLAGFNRGKRYCFDFDSAGRHTDNIGSCSLESFAGRDVAGSVGADVLVSSLVVLPLDEGLIIDIESRFAESASVEVLGFDTMDVTCIARDLSGGFGLAERLELIVNFGGDMSESALVLPCVARHHV